MKSTSNQKQTFCKLTVQRLRDGVPHVTCSPPIATHTHRNLHENIHMERDSTIHRRATKPIVEKLKFHPLKKKQKWARSFGTQVRIFECGGLSSLLYGLKSAFLLKHIASIKTSRGKKDSKCAFLLHVSCCRAYRLRQGRGVSEM